MDKCRPSEPLTEHDILRAINSLFGLNTAGAEFLVRWLFAKEYADKLYDKNNEPQGSGAIFLKMQRRLNQDQGGDDADH